jgi:hypothetical protein
MSTLLSAIGSKGVRALFRILVFLAFLSDPIIFAKTGGTRADDGLGAILPLFASICLVLVLVAVGFLINPVLSMASGIRVLEKSDFMIPLKIVLGLVVLFVLGVGADLLLMGDIPGIAMMLVAFACLVSPVVYLVPMFVGAIGPAFFSTRPGVSTSDSRGPLE